MYLHRSLAALKFRHCSCKSKITGTVHALRAIRWQSSVAPRRKTGALRWLTYGLGAATVGFGGIIAYANHDASFKRRLDAYVPGFGSLADYAGETWTTLYNKVFPKTTSIGIKTEPGKKGWQTGPQPAQPVRGEPVAPAVSSPAQSSVEQNKTPESPKGTMESPAHKPVEAEEREEKSPAQDTATSAGDAGVPAPPAPPAESRETAPPVSLGVTGSDTVGHEGGQTEAGSDGGKHHEEPMTCRIEDSPARVAAAKEVADKLQTLVDSCTLLSDKLKKTRQQLSDAIGDHKKRHSVVGTDKGGVVSEENRQGVEEGPAGVLEGVQAAEASLKAAEADMEVALHTLREQLAEAGKHGLGNLVEGFEQKMHSAVADFDTQKGGVAEALDLGKQIVGKYQEAEKSEHRGEGQPVVESGGHLEVQLSDLKRRHQEELDGLLHEAEQKLASALEQQRQTLESANEGRLQVRLEEQERLHKEDLRVKMADLQRKYEIELRDQLRIQIEAHGDHIRDALDKQAKDITAQWAANMDSKLQEQETRQQLEMAKAMSYLKGIESMVDAVATTGKAVSEQLSLRSAFDSLYCRLHQINRCSKPHVRYSIAGEVAVVKAAASGDFFIAEIISSVPSAALSDGVQSATGLKARFGKVKKMCRRVALVPENGGLGAYALSFLHSVLTFDIGHVDGDAPTENMAPLDLLRLAEASLNGDDLEAAVRYMNQLSGEPRRVAQDWMKDARLYLETVQAADLVAAYLSTSGMPAQQ